jgi:hypothetical protein
MVGGVTTTEREPQRGVPAAAELLRRSWHALTQQRTGVEWVEWNDPAVEAVIIDIAAGRDPWLSLRELVRARAITGFTISEVLIDLAALRDADPSGSTSSLHGLEGAILLEDWYTEDVRRQQREVVQDSLTGLATAEYLKHFLRDLYRSVGVLGGAGPTFQLFLVDLPSALNGSELDLAQLRIGGLLCEVFAGRPIALLSAHRFAVLIDDTVSEFDDLELKISRCLGTFVQVDPGISRIDLPSSAAESCDWIETLRRED